MSTQAERVFARFGGVRPTAEALARLGPRHERVLTSLYRWLYPRPRGTGGLIPTSAMPDILAAARIEGIVFTPEDLYPGRL